MKKLERNVKSQAPYRLCLRTQLPCASGLAVLLTGAGAGIAAAAADAVVGGRAALVVARGQPT
jgi:hypothetical protein